ncbi:MAG: hypothetical protein RBU21_02825 [FCB group bacterium]|jgi:hypothetical protein|nr:hypothetical protein [FCB group bacterium]
MILNLTQHQPSAEQQVEGVVDLPAAERAILIKLLTFDALPGRGEILARAHDIAELACQNGLGGDGDDPHPQRAMIGGAPYLMGVLEDELRARGIAPVYAFTRRETVEQVDGSVRKVAIFRHAGWVEARPCNADADAARSVHPATPPMLQGQAAPDY